MVRIHSNRSDYKTQIGYTRRVVKQSLTKPYLTDLLLFLHYLEIERYSVFHGYLPTVWLAIR